MQADKLAFLVCPVTHGPLMREGQSLVSAVGDRYRILPSGQVDFVGTEPSFESGDFLNQVKSWLKHRLGPGYITLTWILSPVLPRIHWPTRQTWWRYLATRWSAGKPLVIQMGSGNDRVSEDIVNLDIFPFPAVDIVADCRRLPFADASVDGVISLAMLEHVEDPDAYLREARRVLKPGGFVISGAPFMQGYHASPDDYYRWTPSGLQALHARHGFTMQEVTAMEGPTSGFLWLLQEWLSIALCCGLNPLYYFWYLLFALLLFPLKLLDLLLIHFPQSYRINAFNLYVGTLG